MKTIVFAALNATFLAGAGTAIAQDKKTVAIQQALRDQITDGTGECDAGNKIVRVLKKLAGERRKRKQDRVLAEDRVENSTLHFAVRPSRDPGRPPLAARPSSAGPQNIRLYLLREPLVAHELRHG